MRRVRLVSILGLIATVLVIAASVYVLTGRNQQQAAVTQQDQRVRLLDLIAQGKISGDQALELAKFLQADAFEEAATTPDTAPDTPLVARANATEAERAAIAQAPRINRRDMMVVARASFVDAAATLLQEPDERIRAAVVQVRVRDTRDAGLDALWAIAREGGAASSAIWRACGSLMLAEGDERAATALENARALNPQDKGLWRLLSFAYARQNRPREAASAALVGEGISAASTSNWREATARLDQALPLVSDPQVRGFVLGQLGDAAAATENWESAEKNYRAALEMHGAKKNTAALALDSSKLARAQLKRGDERRACITLRRARAQGAVVTDAELQQACQTPRLRSAPNATTPSTPLEP